MTPLGNRRRRRRAAWFLGLALLMLLASQTVLRPHLEGVPFIIYWLGCMVFSLMAMVTAARELGAVTRQAREARKDLLRHTLREVTPPTRPSSPPPPGEKSPMPRNQNSDNHKQ